MKTINIDGLPGITIQGKKGQSGRPGNKTILYSKSYSPDLTKSCLCYLIKTPWSLNDYNFLKSDVSDEKKTEFLIKYSNFIESVSSSSSPEGSEDTLMILSYDSSTDVDVYDYDYFLYPTLNSTELYIVTSNIFENSKNSEAEGIPKEDESAVTNVKFLLWKIDDWKYISGTSILEENDVKIEITEVTKAYSGWEGLYYLDKNIPCIPAGTSEYNNGESIEIIETGAGHLFIPTVFNKNTETAYLEEKATIIDSTRESINLQFPLAIHGTLYDIETEEPIPNFIDSIGLYTASERDDNKNFNFGDLSRKFSTDENGEFNISIDSIDDFPYALISTSYSDKYVSNVMFFLHSNDEYYTEEDFGDVKFYLYRTENFANIYKYDNFSKVNIYSAYNTSKIGVEDTEEQYTPEEIEKIHERVAKYIKFSYKSNLSNIENSKIKVEAEFVIADSQYAIPSTCYAKQWTSEERTSLPNSHPGGRIENFDNTFNFDSENLRDFTLVIKDYEQTNGSLPSIIVPDFIYDNYNIYIYMYYKNSGGSAKKMLLGEDHIDIKLAE